MQVDSRPKYNVIGQHSSPRKTRPGALSCSKAYDYRYDLSPSTAQAVYRTSAEEIWAIDNDKC